jgi:hypothetical protein
MSPLHFQNTPALIAGIGAMFGIAYNKAIVRPSAKNPPKSLKLPKRQNFCLMLEMHEL